MNADKLIHMANQIAQFFRAYPEQEAIAGIREHLATFWTSGMRATLRICAEQEDKRLDPLVAAAIMAQQREPT